jgi:hypothetical protein
MSDLPEPLVPDYVDLRNFMFMPLDVRRLRDSDTAAVEDPEAFRAAVILWCVAWHNIPAASVPDDDASLCRMAGYGRDMKTWRRARENGALNGFVRCSDGRLYHRVIAEKALESWDKKQGHRTRMEQARTAKQQRKEQVNDSLYDRDNYRDNDSVNDSVNDRPSTGSVVAPIEPLKGEGEGERKKETPTAPLPGSAAGEAPREKREASATRGRRLPDHWTPRQAEIDKAAEIGVDVGRAVEEFGNYWRAASGKNAAKLNWDLTFRNRLVELAEAGRFRVQPRGKRAEPSAANPLGQEFGFMSGAL